MFSKIIYINNIKKMRFISEKFSFFLNKGNFLYLSGPLGCGKSFFCNFLVKKLGYKGIIKSPTYSLVNIYNLKFFNVFHFDFYRLLSFNELFDIDIYSYFNNDNICLVEWPDKFINYLPKPTFYLKFSYLKLDKRIIIVNYYNYLYKKYLSNF